MAIAQSDRIYIPVSPLHLVAPGDSISRLRVARSVLVALTLDAVAPRSDAATSRKVVDSSIRCTRSLNDIDGRGAVDQQAGELVVHRFLVGSSQLVLW